MIKKTLPFIFLIVFLACQNKDQETNDIEREIINLNENWTFQIDSSLQGIDKEWYKNGLPQAQKINVPHTWNVQPGWEEYHGYAWYEKIFTADEKLKNKFNRIKFEAIYHTATVWLNGKKISEHIGSGYIPFYADVSDALNYGSENRLCILVDNSFSRNAIPWGRSFDWAADGGITRDVFLISSGKPAIQYAHFTPIPDLNTNKGKVKFDLYLLATEGMQGQLEIEIEISKNGEEIEEIEFEHPVAKHIVHEFELENIDLWHFDQPHLYDVEVEIEKENIETDIINTRFAFRKFETKGDRLLLNGDTVRLMAVEWMPGSSTENGMAQTKQEWFKQLERIKEVNCVLTRFHWQQDKEIFDWCDKNGLLVQEEIPLWGNMMPPFNDTIKQISINQLTGMINEHYNHPSIVMWGIGNEYNKEGTPKLMDDLYNYCKNMDSSRLITYVSNGLHENFENDGSNRGDILMWNNYTETWFGKDIEKIPVFLDAIHEAIPNKPLIIAEYGLCEPAHKGGDPRRIEQLKIHNQYYDSREWIAGAIYFSLNDYRTHMGEEGKGVLKQRVHGVYDIHGNPKPSKILLKNISAPLTISKTKLKNDSLWIKIYAKNKLPAYTCHNYYLTLSAQERGEALSKFKLPTLHPGDSTSINLFLPDKAQFINIYRPNGFHVSTKAF